MDNFTWQHIDFGDGSNPYICKTVEDFNRIKGKYGLIRIKDNFWTTKNKRVNDWLYKDLLMEQQEQM